jgi:multiple sugar transport system permease protein
MGQTRAFYDTTKATERYVQPQRINFRSLLVYFNLILVTFLVILPVLWLFLTTLKLESEYGRYPVVVFPAVPQWSNYITAVLGYNGAFLEKARNSLVLAIPTTAITVLSSAMAGFAFARLNAPGKKYLFIMVLSLLMVPRMVTTIPNFMLFASIGLTNTYWPWYLWALSGSSFHIFLFRQFFSAIPKDLEDAAEVDGCSRFRIFWQIFLPLSGPVLATSAIFHFQWVWGDWFTPNIFLSAQKTTLSVFINSGVYSTPQGYAIYTLQMAATMVYLLPMLIIFLFAQKYIVQGIVTSGLKG